MKFQARKAVCAAIVICAAAQTVSAAPWKFAVMDDSRAAGAGTRQSNGVATQVLGICAADIAKQGVDLVVFPGDMVTGETTAPDATALASEFSTWKQAMKPVYDASIPVYTTRGNHEFYAGKPFTTDFSATPFKDAFVTNGSNPNSGAAGEEGMTYTFAHKNAQFTAIDEYANRTSSFNNKLYAPGSNSGQMMNSFVTNAINTSTAGVNFAFGHEQLFPSQSHSDCLANDPDSRDALVGALLDHNGTYLTGHDHMFLRGTATIDGKSGFVPELVVGTAGGGNYNYAPFDDRAAGYNGPAHFATANAVSNASNPTFGYVLITVNDDNTWSGEFHSFQFTNWTSTTDYSTTPITVTDTFTSSTVPEPTCLGILGVTSLLAFRRRRSA